MGSRDSARNRVILAGALALWLGSGVVASPVAEAGPLRTKLLRIINRVRDNHDLRPLRLNLRLSEDAKAHTRRMIRRGELFDPPNLAELLEPYRWDDLGADAVGCDETLNAVVRRWLEDEPHREIVLHPALRRAGIGVIRVDGRSGCGRDQAWVTAIMYG
ncbi:MAG: hypothetical protein KatS3mg014_1355 [Actinomycetota bacterium]|nr:MAG: hypothetical protein KatS3mg014_1355 [Actinomycetota bacterium]